MPASVPPPPFAPHRAWRPLALAAAVLLTSQAPGSLTQRAEAAQLPTADELLAASIEHHDPNGQWREGGLRLTLAETRPNGSDRRTVLHFGPSDAPRGQRFTLEQTADGHVTQGVRHGELCTWSLDGSDEITEAERAEHRLTCDRLALLRDYYGYLWGLPMKLRDPGTRLGAVTRTTFDDREVLALAVEYDPEVGTDSWDVFFDPETSALVGYRFFHDREKGDGEWIRLDGTTRGAGLALPAERTWFTNQGDELLGSDRLVEIVAIAAIAAIDAIDAETERDVMEPGDEDARETNR